MHLSIPLWLAAIAIMGLNSKQGLMLNNNATAPKDSMSSLLIKVRLYVQVLQQEYALSSKSWMHIHLLFGGGIAEVTASHCFVNTDFVYI